MKAIDFLDNVFPISEELRKEFPELKNITAIEGKCNDYEHAGTFKKAKIFAKNLRKGGHTDWRLPTLKEIKCLCKECDILLEFGKNFPIEIDFEFIFKYCRVWTNDGKMYDCETEWIAKTFDEDDESMIFCVR